MNLTDYAKQNGLVPVGTRPNPFAYIKSSIQRRAFAFALARYALLASTARSKLGVIWIVLTPTLQVALYGLIFGLVLGDTRPDNFVAFLIIGVVVFQFISGSFVDGTKSITSNASLVRSMDFPRILLPFATTFSQLGRFLGVLPLALLALIIIGERPDLDWFGIIPVVILILVFAFGLSMLSARLTTDFSDLSQLIPFLNRLLFYSSGVFFSIEKLINAYGFLEFLRWANPISVYLELARGAVVTGYESTMTDWLTGVIWAVGMLSTGFIFFWLAEEKYGRVN